MTQKEILTHALHGVEWELISRCALVADGALNQKNVDEIMNLICNRAEIKAKLTEEDA